MVSLDHERLLHHIDEYNHSSLEGWKQFHALFNQARQLETPSAIYHQLFPLLKRHGFHTTLLSHDPAWIFSKLDTGAAHTILLYNRYATGSLNIWDACAIASQILTVELYRKWTGNIPVNIKWLLNLSDTTSASPPASLPSLLEEGRQSLQADGCLCDEIRTSEENMLFSIAEDTPLLFSGCKGLLNIELASHVTATPISSHYGSIVPDAAWRLLWALNSLKNGREEIMIDGFYDAITPIEDDAALYSLPDTASALVEQWGLPDLLLGVRGLQMHYAHLLTPSCTIKFITGGNETSAQIPSQAKALVDFSLVPGQEPDDIFARLQHHLQEHGFSDIQVQQRSSCPPAYTPRSHPFVQLVSSAITQAWKHAPLMLPITPSSHPLAPLQQQANIPILTISTGIPRTSPSQWNHPTVTALLKHKLRQTALILHQLGNMI
ncbi:peptidase M20 [Reticulibacter mediterranei]|uniref:Peptidase M20 n=1 Tax=Reticulibacter mediterranei TaxID=2778369 RepID=A0A8J3N0Q3_9CHLR|nr:peptidase dimerization domain-containing protein [Reticulibacter mediterranei]GHO91748.1 peptidase M20 [Reticulibacter mediterranei]